MSISKLTDILDLLAGMSIAPELIGQERIKGFQRSATAFLARLQKTSPGLLVLSFALQTFIILLNREARRSEPTAHYLIRFTVTLAIAVAFLFIFDFIHETPTLEQLPDVVVVLILILLVYLFLVLLGLLLLLLAWMTKVVSALLFNISKRVELSRALFVAGFLIFFGSGLLKIFLT
jgi:hypothetical protein